MAKSDIPVSGPCNLQLDNRDSLRIVCAREIRVFDRRDTFRHDRAAHIRIGFRSPTRRRADGVRQIDAVEPGRCFGFVGSGFDRLGQGRGKGLGV